MVRPIYLNTKYIITDKPEYLKELLRIYSA